MGTKKSKRYSTYIIATGLSLMLLRGSGVIDTDWLIVTSPFWVCALVLIYYIFVAIFKGL